MTKILLPVALLILAFKATDKLTGRWETVPSPAGNVTGVIFKPDLSFEGYINKKPFVTGNYSLKDSLFSFVDNGCEGKGATYKIIFFSNDDSVRFVPVEDPCTERMNGMSRLVMGRVN